jgi:hypothetical protein
VLEIEAPRLLDASAAAPLGFPQRTPSRWRSLLTAANLAVAEIYEPPRRHLADISHEFVLVFGDIAPGIVEGEPESVVTFTTKRPTLWLPEVPILPRRRAFFGFSTGDDE